MNRNNNKKIEEIKKQTTPIFKEYGVKRAAVFGSYVKKKYNKKSDIDILVEIKADISLLGFVELKQRLEEKLNKKVDLVEYQTIKPGLKKEILNTQVPIL